MRARVLAGIVPLAALAGCGMENLLSNVAHDAWPRPASVIEGAYALPGASISQVSVLDGDGNAVEPFAASMSGTAYELRLPSAPWSFLRTRARSGNLELRALVPSIARESTTGGVDLDARGVTEALIVEAALSAKGLRFKQLTPAAYVGDGVTNGTRTVIRAAFDDPATNPAQELLGMVVRILARHDPASGVLDPDFFGVPVLDAAFTVTTSPLGSAWLARSPLDYDGDLVAESTTADFDAKLGEVAALYDPEGCPDPDRVRVVFTADFTSGTQDGNCAAVNRFKWAVDKPGKQMFFVGWVHVDSAIQDPLVNAALGAGVPNTVPMFDDATNADEVAGDGIWTVAFDVPKGIRVGYKYTWGTPGAPWTGSEEWPGNSRLLEVVDVNGDDLVYRRDVFGDEATNKDRMNLFNGLPGNVIDWTTDLHACGPEVHEQRFTPHVACLCGTAWSTPDSVGPLTVACTAP